MQGLPERLDLFARHAALGPVRLQQDVLDAARRAAGADEADRRADADDAVNAAVGFLDGLDRVRLVVRQIRNRRVGVLDLAFECRNEALAHPAETFGEWIDGHDYGPRTGTGKHLHARVNIIWLCRIMMWNTQLYLHTNNVFSGRMLSHILCYICTTTYRRPAPQARTTGPGSTSTPPTWRGIELSPQRFLAIRRRGARPRHGAARRYPCHRSIPRMLASPGHRAARRQQGSQ